jgi:hypothetical protein
VLPLPTLTRLIPRLRAFHTPLTSTTFVLLVITGGLGLHLASQTRPIILVYTAISLAVLVFLFVVQSCIRKRGSAYARATNRNRGEEEDDSDRVVMLGKMEERRSGSAASLGRPPAYGTPYGSYNGSSEFGADGQQHQRSPMRSHYGGGTMPGPQYLLNMHPGVPVQVSRM